MTYTPRQIADAINNARAMATDWREWSLVRDTAATILAGPDASLEMVAEAEAEIEREMK